MIHQEDECPFNLVGTQLRVKSNANQDLFLGRKEHISLFEK